MYATVFAGLYLPLLAILCAMIVRVVAIEWRGKIDDPGWQRWADIAIAVGSWVPAILWGVAFAGLVRGLPVDADRQMHLTIGDVLNAYTLLGGLATGALFALHGAVFVALKTSGQMRTDAFGFAARLAIPATVLVAGFGLWTQLAHGKPWTWIVLAVAVVAQIAAVTRVFSRSGEGWAFAYTSVVVAAVVILLFGALFPNLVPSSMSGLEPHDLQRIVLSLHPQDHDLGGLIFAPLVIVYQGWTYWVFRKRISADRIPAPVGLSRRSD